MTGGASAEHSRRVIASAGEALGRARNYLLQPAPQNLDIACSVLATALAQVTELRKGLTASPDSDLAATVLGLRQEIDGTSRLLEHAASYHVALMKCMIESSAAPVPQAPGGTGARRISVEV